MIEVSVLHSLPTLRGTSQLSSEVHAISYLLQVLFAPSFLRFENSNSESNISSNISPSISADSYATNFPHVYNVWHHSARAIMDSWGFSCIQSQQVSTTDRDRYNKLTRANRAITNISPALSTTMPTTQSSISKPRLPTKNRTFQSNPALRLWRISPVIPVNWEL